jgi:hypothetical protein
MVSRKWPKTTPRSPSARRALTTTDDHDHGYMVPGMAADCRPKSPADHEYMVPERHYCLAFWRKNCKPGAADSESHRGSASALLDRTDEGGEAAPASGTARADRANAYPHFDWCDGKNQSSALRRLWGRLWCGRPGCTIGGPVGWQAGPPPRKPGREPDLLTEGCVRSIHSIRNGYPRVKGCQITKIPPHEKMGGLR